MSDYNESEVLGICPKCGARIIENSKFYGCEGWKEGCRFSIWKNDRYFASMQKELTKDMVKDLLRDGKILVEGLISKKGNSFDAILSYSENPETGYYNWSMEFPDKK